MKKVFCLLGFAALLAPSLTATASPSALTTSTSARHLTEYYDGMQEGRNLREYFLSIHDNDPNNPDFQADINAAVDSLNQDIANATTMEQREYARGMIVGLRG